MQRNLLSLLLSFLTSVSFAQSPVIKYFDANAAVSDLKLNRSKSSYFPICDPDKLLYLNCDYYDELKELYQDLAHIGKSEYCYKDEQGKVIDFSPKTFIDVFDDEQKTTLLLKEVLGIDYNDQVYIVFPIYLYYNLSLIEIEGSSWSSNYRLGLKDNKLTIEFCSGIQYYRNRRFQNIEAD